MTKTFIIIAFSALLFGCKKTKDENPKPDVDFSAWANTGNTIFNGTPVLNPPNGSDSVHHSDHVIQGVK